MPENPKIQGLRHYFAGLNENFTLYSTHLPDDIIRQIEKHGYIRQSIGAVSYDDLYYWHPYNITIILKDECPLGERMPVLETYPGTVFRKPGAGSLQRRPYG
jgi:hypothetical protein